MKEESRRFYITGSLLQLCIVQIIVYIFVCNNLLKSIFNTFCSYITSVITFKRFYFILFFFNDYLI